MPAYSALAGFMEPGETFEDSIKRELWEEAGIRVQDIKYHSSQPWVSGHIPLRWINRFTRLSLRLYVQPFPANLMVGFYATASESQQLRVDLDNELTGKWNRPHFRYAHFIIAPPSDARWFTREEIITVLNHPQGTNLGPMYTSQQLSEHDPPFRVPPKTAIAGVLISDWANGKPLDSHCTSPRL